MSKLVERYLIDIPSSVVGPVLRKILKSSIAGMTKISKVVDVVISYLIYIKVINFGRLDDYQYFDEVRNMITKSALFILDGDDKAEKIINNKVERRLNAIKKYNIIRTNLRLDIVLRPTNFSFIDVYTVVLAILNGYRYNGASNIKLEAEYIIGGIRFYIKTLLFDNLLEFYTQDKEYIINRNMVYYTIDTLDVLFPNFDVSQFPIGIENTLEVMVDSIRFS